ncbi:SDR family oxidoreductase [Bradyrhizobium sp. U87765 SZCCT0131]|uniref:SDR family NAD(P)-dependent oxidoreductase n=1 Tax=unclassified Bradyrhizobium TaxID=2631580 RepID=UPI001BAD399D|nr:MULTISPECIES: SDR family NAD(P)-dependent oxidoreductase [unclassified Bradyrhizobium]MBR1217716.1 SDR family oxidoreductase [Bradyrhizobium sp. U87765 SZCCT0131]MBR1261338.1 SDR family oxidoreductase [Bradyrhizobium sp. U87765 SZCCT0134]MBR1303214.1 SDR family oxidoreductase [Bradyrhizobium sp. U87765 SZCCT0110]MBR1318820.1 SDR family oxidoreductase [Bradyrhizobium sp. U87765 SZCCT0109]MBR1347145.1 SDR family oxidoreductase [Bradyrhizobium sp. U87765 SZCCT0048]
MGLLNGKTCIVTGGAGSLGIAAARLFLKEGARVMLLDRREAELRTAEASLASTDVVGMAVDVTDRASVEAALDAAVARFGKIDVLFSNAGNFGTVRPIAEYPEDVFDAVYAVHVKGAFLMCKLAAPRMNDGGSIVITSSVAGTRGDPGVYAYITAKHAQVGLMRCLAKELAGRRIRVNTIHPGPIANDFQQRVEDDLSEIIGRNATEFFDSQIPLGRHASPDEVAKSVVYLASDQSSFTTGAMLMVDGGMSA